MNERKYLPTFAELVDRLSIVLLKQIFLDGSYYEAERELIEHDLDLLLQDRKFNALNIRAMLMVAIANRYIWENESKAREGGSEQDKRLKTTHSINGVRQTAKNLLTIGDERRDAKIDCLAADLPPEFGNWKVF